MRSYLYYFGVLFHLVYIFVVISLRIRNLFFYHKIQNDNISHMRLIV